MKKNCTEQIDKFDNQSHILFVGDSGKLRIPVHACTYIHPEITEHIIAYGEDTIVDYSETAAKKRSVEWIVDGISMYFEVRYKHLKGKKFTGSKIGEKFLFIKWNAKALKGKYLLGLSGRTVHRLWQYINSSPYVEIPYEVFLDSAPTDNDIRRDLPIDVHSFKTVIMPFLADIAKSYKEIDKGSKPYSAGLAGSKGLGYRFGSRDKATATYPQLNIYQKELEFKYHAKTAEFAAKYLKGQEDHIVDRTRFEMTIKDKAHFNRYLRKHNEKCETLRDMIHLIDNRQDIFQEMQNDMFDIHTTIMNKEEFKEDMTELIEMIELGDSKKPIMRQFKEVAQLTAFIKFYNCTPEQAYEMISPLKLANTPAAVSQRKRIHKDLREIYNRYIKHSTVGTQIEQIENFKKLLFGTS
jgi:hypothetical protein